MPGQIRLAEPDAVTAPRQCARISVSIVAMADSRIAYQNPSRRRVRIGSSSEQKITRRRVGPEAELQRSAQPSLRSHPRNRGIRGALPG